MIPDWLLVLQAICLITVAALLFALAEVNCSEQERRIRETSPKRYLREDAMWAAPTTGVGCCPYCNHIMDFCTCVWEEADTDGVVMVYDEI